jgi:prophage tail gpP-like protein
MGLFPPKPGEIIFDIIAPSDVIKVYIDGGIAFTGSVDEIPFSGDASSAAISVDARGKTKALVDASHKHKTGQIKGTSSKKAIEQLCKDCEIDVDFIGEDQEIKSWTLSDGNYTDYEIDKIATENGHYVYEDKQGRLRVTDDTARQSGRDLYVGQDSILSFSGKLSEGIAKAEITVKGKRTDPEVRGKARFNESLVKIKDKSVKTKSRVTIHHFGDGTKKSLERRAKFEAGKRAATTKSLTVDVFGASAEWDIGLLHNISIPMFDVNDQFECVGIDYEWGATSCKTTLQFAPPPTANIGGSVSSATKGLAGHVANKRSKHWGGADLELYGDETQYKASSALGPF